MNNLTFGQFCNELVNLYKVREGMTGDQSRRYVLDALDYFKQDYDDGYSPQESYQIDVDNWGESNV